MSRLRVCSLFSGIGGFDLGLARSGFETVLLCENDLAAQAVLKHRFPNVRVSDDIKSIRSLPNCELVTAGWPCQDLSQAGRTAGISGRQSGLVGEIFRLLDSTRRKPPFILLENVPFALQLEGGKAILQVLKNLERQGYNWAYRILDTREFGVPHRRRRIFVLASKEGNPAPILFGRPSSVRLRQEVAPKQVGFYWTEGNRGIGWTPDAVPPIKGGSGLSIPSPPGVWNCKHGTFVAPGISDAERLQGFPTDWTRQAAKVTNSDRVRWRLVGNAVSVPVAKWLGKQLAKHVKSELHSDFTPDPTVGRRHNASWGGPGRKPQRAYFAVEGPFDAKHCTLSEFALLDAKPLSLRAASGFLSRFLESSLIADPVFVKDLKRYCGFSNNVGSTSARR